jgi:predicted hydrocarbon binding protein
MTQPIDLAKNALVAVTHDSLVSLRTALFRDVGPTAAAVLQEAGYAGGGPMFGAFREWLTGRELPSPEELPASEFASYATDFFRQTGWGSIELGTLESVATIDSADWSESDPESPLEFPGCYFTAGVFADFFGRVAGSPLAVMEVECRSMGNERCRFLLGSAETLQRVYDEMGQGVAYEQAVAG